MTDISSVGAAVSDPCTFLVEPFDVPAHPCNLTFLTAFSDQVMKALGSNLSLLTDHPDQVWAACHVRDFFAPRFDAVVGLPVTPIFPVSSQSTDSPVGSSFDLLGFCAQAAGLDVPQADQVCAVTRNLKWLQSTLHLTSVDQKFLLWTYAISHRRSQRLQDAFGTVRLTSWAQAHAAIALMLEEPVESVALCFAAPSRLSAMRLLVTGRRSVPFGLDECFSTSELLASVLETVHSTPEAMLQRLLEPERHWTLAPELETPSVLYYEWLDRPVADVFAAAVLLKPMTADHIVALVQWLTSMQLSPASCEPLAGRLDLETIEQVLKVCFVEHALRDVPVTAFIVLQRSTHRPRPEPQHHVRRFG